MTEEHRGNMDAILKTLVNGKTEAEEISKRVRKFVDSYNEMEAQASASEKEVNSLREVHALLHHVQKRIQDIHDINLSTKVFLEEAAVTKTPA